MNLGIHEQARAALRSSTSISSSWSTSRTRPGARQWRARTARACFLDSMATTACRDGYGIRTSTARSDRRSSTGLRWSSPTTGCIRNAMVGSRTETLFVVRFGGRVESEEIQGRRVFRWVDTQNVGRSRTNIPVPVTRTTSSHLAPLVGARLARDRHRLLQPRDYVRGRRREELERELSRVLYPNDTSRGWLGAQAEAGIFLRHPPPPQTPLRRHRTGHPTFDEVSRRSRLSAERHAPSDCGRRADAPLGRRKTGSSGTRPVDHPRCFAYTNHTVMPEALELAVGLFEKVLPRHLQDHLRNQRPLSPRARRALPERSDRIRRMSLIDEGNPKRCAWRTSRCWGATPSTRVGLHSRLLREQLFRDFAEPPRQVPHETNGITQRRWLRTCNPLLSELITSAIGERWVTNLDELERLIPSRATRSSASAGAR